MAAELEACCIGLETAKITERKKCTDKLWILLEDKAVLRFLNNGDSRITWNTVPTSVHRLLRKEAEKLEEDGRKKKAVSASSTSYTKRGYGDLLLFVIRKANAKDLLYYLEMLYRNPIPGVEELKTLQCLQLLLQWGPLHSLPSTQLRQEFPFITEVACHISGSVSRSQQEVVLKLLLQFFLQTAEDNRVACCKLGEKLFSDFIGIYQSPQAHDDLKILLLDFFLLQLQIHHPKGAFKDSASAYACSWTDWQKNLRALYSILCHEMDSNIQVKFKDFTHVSGHSGINVLPKTFVTLLVEVFRQVIREKSTNLSDSAQTQDVVQPPSKRQKVEFGVPAIISNIQSSKEWPWMNVMTELLKKYPDLITANDFVCLLRVLSTHQTECKYSNSRYHLYECLFVLVDVETCIDVTEYHGTISELWSVVWECALRAVGLNENEEQTHKLLQKLIVERKTLNSVHLFRTYMSQVLNVSKFSLQTFSTACSRFGLPEFTLNTDSRAVIIKWILNIDKETIDVLSEPIAAQVLLFLTSKQWPKANMFNDVKCNTDIYNVTTIEDVYFITYFDGGLVLDKDKQCSKLSEELTTANKNLYYSQQNSLDDMIKQLCELANYFLLKNESKNYIALKNDIIIIILMANVISFMLYYGILDEENVKDHKCTELLNVLLEKYCTTLQGVLTKLNDKHGAQLCDIFNKMKTLFTLHLHDTVVLIIRKRIPVELIREIFQLINQEEENKENETNQEHQEEGRVKNQSIKLNLIALDVLSSYCCVPNLNCVFDVQQKALETLADPNFDPELTTDYEIAMHFLHSLKNYKPGTLTNTVLDKALQSIQAICKVRYTNYRTALSVLEILYNLYPHVALSNSEQLKENAVVLLQPFYDERNNYGPIVSAMILKCIGQLAKVDPNATWAKWEGDKEIVAEIVQFLSSDFQQVRLTAIQNVCIIFSNSCEDNFRLTRHNLIFDAICAKCTAVFNVGGNLSEERRVDETVTRTASALHTLAAVIAINSVFRQKSVFALLQLVYKKTLHLDSTVRVLDMASKHLGIQDTATFLKLNLNYLVSQWHAHNYPLKEFPYFLLGCSSEIEFYANHLYVIVPLLIADDLSCLTEVCNQNEKSLKEIVEICFPNMMARCILTSTSDLPSDRIGSEEEIEYKNRCLQNLINILTNQRLETLLVEKLEDITCCLLQFCFDPDDINNKFSFKCPLPEPQLPFFPVAVVLKTIQDIENKYLNKCAIIPYCMRNCPGKLQKILLKITAAIYESTSVEEKVIAFHHFTILVDLIIPWLQANNGFRSYLIRTISYTLIHLIRNKYEDDSILNLMCCKYFSTFISKILPDSAMILEKCLVTFVSILIPIAKCNTNIGIECTDLLNLMIVDYVNELREAIKTLDPFPQEPKFSKMQTVYNVVKYGKKAFELEEEIEHFLNTGNLMGSSGCRTEGLKHLKSNLSCKKNELKELYSKLYNLKGFSEDCVKSILHRLICMLVKLSLSTDANESVEATRCLGQLGPADLLTTVLQAEQKCVLEKLNPFELVTGCVTALLTKYIVDFDIKLIQVASEALYHVLDCKEGKIVLASGIDYGQGLIDKTYITPFISSRKIRSDSSYALKNNFEELVNCNTLWCPEDSVSHSEWITELVCTILKTFTDKCYLSNLVPVCKVKVAFSEHILPLLVYLILSSGYADMISSQIQRFFQMHWNLNLHVPTMTDKIVVNKLSVQCMLNVVHFVRLRKNIENTRQFGELSLNYLHVAQAAQFCTAHFTALLYVELWCQERLTEIRVVPSTTTIYTLGVTPLDIIFQHEEPVIRQALQNILREGYRKVGETDALRTCETIGMLDNKSQIEHYEHLEKWEQVTLLYDIQVSEGNNACTPKLLDALRNCSLFQLPLKYPNCVEPQFECAWRLSHWKINETDLENVQSYEKYKYFALKALHNNDSSNFKSAITDARNSIISCLRHASLESSKNLYELLSQLQSLQELEDFLKAKNENNLESLLENWNIQDQINRNQFQYMEPIHAQRMVIVNDLVTHGFDALKNSLIDMHLKLAGLARIEGKQNVTTRTLRSLLHLGNLTAEVENKIRMEEAQMYWSDDKTTARHILLNLLNKSPSPRLHAAALKLCGTWMVETFSENPQIIISNYFLKSLDILEGLEKNDVDKHNMYETYDVLARFADLQYQQVLTYIKSSIFERKVQNMEKSKKTAEGIKSQANGRLSRDEARAILTHERQSVIDKTEINNTRKEKDFYLIMAVKYYMLNLQHSDSNNVRMFRILSLWFENRTDAELGKNLKENLSKISSHKYIPILPQLIPHITVNMEDNFNSQINDILERCALQHPHHTLPVILALTNSNEDKNHYKSTTNTVSNEPRVAGAEKLIKKFKSRGHSLQQLVHRMETLSKALIHLAYVDQANCNTDRQENFLIPNSCSLTKIKNFDDVLLPTYTLPIKKNGDYSNIVGIHSFGKTFVNAGGLNAPKRITCMGTDGQNRVQLVKGKDDLRQDAVMQQVFNIMNGLLQSNQQTAKLLIRTYKIVPLSQRSGILEWVENSMPLGVYLVGDGKGGAHQQYNTNDITPAKCRSEFQNVAKLPNDEKLRVYKDICRRFQPVFHKFFENSFVQPAIWYERRRAYMYSVATSSMCGYILGLGDRHVHNILIDKRTGEVVHIDFGIAFEQGRVLPTSETVPFRLTRDIEAGMGVSGIEGVFRKSCEKTLEVLRKNAETIITILEVLLYDPLYAWTITPAEAYSRQFNYDQDGSTNHSYDFSDQENVPVNVTAERALLRLRQKLQGTTEGASTSIEGQVEKLLQQARDPSNLCKLFHGWQPYL